MRPSGHQHTQCRYALPARSVSLRFLWSGGRCLPPKEKAANFNVAALRYGQPSLCLKYDSSDHATALRGALRSAKRDEAFKWVVVVNTAAALNGPWMSSQHGVSRSLSPQRTTTDRQAPLAVALRTTSRSKGRCDGRLGNSCGHGCGYDMAAIVMTLAL